MALLPNTTHTPIQPTLQYNPHSSGLPLYTGLRVNLAPNPSIPILHPSSCHRSSSSNCVGLPAFLLFISPIALSTFISVILSLGASAVPPFIIPSHTFSMFSRYVLRVLLPFLHDHLWLYNFTSCVSFANSFVIQNTNLCLLLKFLFWALAFFPIFFDSSYSAYASCSSVIPFAWHHALNCSLFSLTLFQIIPPPCLLIYWLALCPCMHAHTHTQTHACTHTNTHPSELPSIVLSSFSRISCSHNHTNVLRQCTRDNVYSRN